MQIGDDILLEVVCHLDTVSVIRLLSTSKRFWNNRNKPRVIERITPYQKYIKYEQWNNGLQEALKRNDIPQIIFFLARADKYQEALNYAFFKGNITLINYFTDLSSEDMKNAIQNAAKGGHKLIVNRLLIRNKMRKRLITAAIIGACAGGHTTLLLYLMALYNNKKEPIEMTAWNLEWNEAVEAAAQGGHTEIVKMLIDLGYDKYMNALCFALRGNNLALVEYLWEKTGRAPLENTLWYPCENGNKKMVEWLVERGASNWGNALMAATTGGHIDIVNFILENAVGLDEDNYLECAYEACRKGHLEIFKLFASEGVNLPHLVEVAAEHGQLEIVKYFVQQGHEWLNGALYKASSNDHREIIEYLIENGASDYNEALRVAASRGNVPLAKFYLQKGAIYANTAADSAVLYGRPKMVEFFVDHGYITLDNAIKLAEEYGKSDIASYFKGRKGLQ